MYTIGQFSRMGRIPAKTLRFYDEIGLLKPVHVDEINQYRYYSAEQLCDVLLIGELKDYNFSLDEIKALVHTHDPQLLENALKRKLEEMERELGRIALAQQNLRSKVKKLQEGGTIMSITANFKIELKEREAISVAYLRRRLPLNDMTGMVQEFCQKLDTGNARVAGSLMAIYHDEEFKPEDADIEVAIPVQKAVPGLETREMAGGTHACTIWVGPYSGLGAGYAAIGRWISENGYEIINPPYDIYLVGPESTDNEEKYVTEISFPVRKK